jgi:hypothetical protein
MFKYNRIQPILLFLTDTITLGKCLLLQFVEVLLICLLYQPNDLCSQCGHPELSVSLLSITCNHLYCTAISRSLTSGALSDGQGQ